MQSEVKSYMTGTPVTIEPDASALAALDLMVEHGIRHLPVVHGNRRVCGVLSFDGRTVTLDSVRGELGHAPVALSGTISPFDEPPRVDLAVKGDNLLLARDFYLRLRADVDLTITGPLDGLLVKGAVGIRDAIYSRPLQLMVQTGRCASATTSSGASSASTCSWPGPASCPSRAGTSRSATRGSRCPSRA